MQVVLGRGLHLRLIDQAQSVDRCRWLSTLLRLQVVPMGVPGLEVQWMIRHDTIVWIHSSHLDQISVVLAIEPSLYKGVNFYQKLYKPVHLSTNGNYSVTAVSTSHRTEADSHEWQAGIDS